MSLKANPLHSNKLSATVLPMADLADRVRLRFREEMTRKRLSQRELAQLLDWSQSRVAKLLTGRVEMGVSDLESLGFAIGVSPVEAVRDHGLEFLAEMTPTELRTLERIRQLPQPTIDALMQLLDIKKPARPERHATALPVKKLRNRG